MSWGPLVAVPVEWAALAALVAGAIYWERAALSGIGVEGSVLAAMLGLSLGYEWTGDYAIACTAGLAAAMAFALLASGLLLSLRADPLVGSLVLSLVPAAALAVLVRATPLRILHENPPPGLISGTIFDGTYAGDLILSPWLAAALLVVVLAAVVMLKTPFGLQLRGYSETPAFARRGSAQVAGLRVTGALLGAIWATPAAGLMLRAHPDSLPVGLGVLALACAVAGRWGFLPAILLALGPAALRALRVALPASDALGLTVTAAPFALALLYLVLLTRRALRAATTAQSRLDPDVL